MKRIFFLLTLCCAIIACKHNDVDFTYSPEAPRAGQTVNFYNLSTSGEDWEWSFGDGSTSSFKSPTHVYKKPGTYVVSVKVDKRNKWMATKELIVYDTIPTFVCKDSLLYIYRDYEFVANVYNPYNYEVKYQWYLPVTNTLLPSGVEPSDQESEWNTSTMWFYFTEPALEVPIGLTVIMNGDTTDVQKYFYVEYVETNSVLCRREEGDYRQRIYGERAATPQLIEKSALLDVEQDTIQTYNDSTFRLSALKAKFPGILGFHIANRKIYYRANGLWVANIDGANKVQIDTLECRAMTLDMLDNRIYWANSEGVWYMPFIGSDNNKFVTIPKELNLFKNVTKLAADSEPE